MPAISPLRLHAPSRPDAVVVELPVVLAPMAGVTNAAYRQLCREQGAGLYVCEMITSRGLVVGDPKTHAMLQFDPGETTRSVQLYGVDPGVMADAARILARDYAVGPHRPQLRLPGAEGHAQGRRGRAARTSGTGCARSCARRSAPPTSSACRSPSRPGSASTASTRPSSTPGGSPQEEGAAAIALHGRTVAQAYSGEADWSRIAELVDAVDIPVLGNGDIWEAEDALRMMDETGCAGVVVGRGCLGRPWLFGDLAAAFARRGAAAPAHAG